MHTTWNTLLSDDLGQKYLNKKQGIVHRLYHYSLFLNHFKANVLSFESFFVAKLCRILIENQRKMYNITSLFSFLALHYCPYFCFSVNYALLLGVCYWSELWLRMTLL